MPVRVGAEREEMTERFARNVMITLLLMLIALTISTFIWGYWL